MADREKDKQDDKQIQGYDFGKTDLASSMKATLGSRFLGMEVDPATSRFMDFAFNQFLPHIAVQIEEHGIKFIKDTLISTGLETDEIRAHNAGKKYAPKLAIAAVLAEPGLSVAGAMYDTANKLNDVRIGLTPSLKSGSAFAASAEALFGSDNEVVQNARARIYSQLYTEIAGTIARSVVTLPALFAVKGRTQARLKSQTDEVDLELAMKDPVARKKYIQERIKGGSGINKAMEEEKFKEIKEVREEYQKEYETFAKGSDGKKVYDEILRHIKDDPSYARELGVTHVLNRPTNGGKVGDSIEKRRRSTGRSNNKDELDRAIEKELKYRFVEDVKHGKALNKEWVKQQRGWGGGWGRNESSDKGFSTIEDGIEHVYKEMLDSMLGKQKAAEQVLKGNPKDPNSINLWDQGVMGFASIAGTQLHKILVGNKKEEYAKPVALNLILHMRKAIHEDKKENHQVATIPNFGESSGDSSFTKYVHKIFEQHQLDSKQSEIGSRYFDHFKEAGFDDEQVFKMEDKDLTAYEVAIKHIARAIKEGQMDSIALINLVGQRRIVQKDAKHFGPKGSNGVPSVLIDEINKQCASNASHAGLSQEQLSAILSNIVFSEEEIKAGFAANGKFKGEEKAFLFMLLDAQIQDAAAMKKLTGLSVPEMDGLRAQANCKFNEHFDAAINAIAVMDDKEVAALAKYDVTADEIRMIREAAESAQAAGKSVNDTITGDESKQLKTAVANVIMAEEQEGKNFWQNRVKAKASEALNSAVSEALQTEAPESSHASLARKRDHKNETSNPDHSLGLAP